MVAVAPKQIINSLKTVVSSVYKEGVDQILSWPQIDERGYLKFRFRGGNQVYDCEISPDNIIGYIEARRSDSILLGAYFGPIAQYIEDSEYAQGLIESEVFRLDGKRCKIGKSCGDTCITVNSKCTARLGLKQKQMINNIREAVSQKAKSTDNTGRNLAIAAGIGGAALLTGGAIAAGIALSGSKNSSTTNRQDPPTPMGSNTPSPEPNPPSPPPRSRNLSPSPNAGALPPAPPPKQRERRTKPPVEQPQNSTIVTEPPISQGKFSDGAVTKIENAAGAIKKTFSQELQDNHQLRVLPKKAPDKGVKEAIGQGIKTFKDVLPGAIAGRTAADVAVDGSIDGMAANVGGAIGQAAVQGGFKAAQSLKKPSARDLAPSVDFLKKTIHVSEASQHADIDTMRGFGQYLHQLGTQDPDRAAKLNKFIDGLLTSSACRRLQSTASTAKTQQAKDNAAFDLQREQVFGRAIAQYAITKQGMKDQQKVLTNQAKTKGTHWNKEEFGRIEKDMDKLFKEFGWTT